MLCRIKADASEPPCSIVAKKVRDETMRSFVKRYGDDHGYGPDGRQIYCVTAHSFDFREPQKHRESVDIHHKSITVFAGIGSGGLGAFPKVIRRCSQVSSR